MNLVLRRGLKLMRIDQCMLEIDRKRKVVRVSDTERALRSHKW